MTTASWAAERGGCGLPLKEVGEQRYEVPRGCQLVASRSHIAPQVNDIRLQLTVSPKAESVAIAVDQIRKGLKLGPLLLVMTVMESARIGALARCLQFDETDQTTLSRDRIVWSSLEVGD